MSEPQSQEHSSGQQFIWGSGGGGAVRLALVHSKGSRNWPVAAV